MKHFGAFLLVAAVAGLAFLLGRHVNAAAAAERKKRPLDALANIVNGATGLFS